MIAADVSNFDSEVLASKGTVAIYFRATWCKACDEMEALVQSAETEYQDVSFLAVNTDTCEEIVLQQAIRTIPTLSIFKDGKVAQKIRGPISEEEFKQSLAESLP